MSYLNLLLPSHSFARLSASRLVLSTGEGMIYVHTKKAVHTWNHDLFVWVSGWVQACGQKAHSKTIGILSPITQPAICK